MITAILLLVCLVLAGVVAALGLALREVRARVQRLETAAGRSPGSLRDASSLGSSGQVETGASAPSSASSAVAEKAAPRPSRDHREDDYVITRLGEEAEESAPVTDSRLFADVLLREAVVKAASLAYGVRRGLSPANRNRIWFEMRREVKRARKDRKAEEREAIRQYRARRRAGVPADLQEESAA